MAGLTRGEVMRKLVHMGVGGIAFTLRFLGPLWSAVCAAGAVAFNFLVLPRLGGRRLWRESDADRGHALGILLYPVAVLLLVLIFWRRLEVAAAVWGILAFGDGTASLAGMAWGRRKLPWNPRKSWVGSGAYLICGTLAATVLLRWTAPGRYPLAFAVGAALATALVAAALESMPQGLDDNIGVPLVAGLFLAGLTETVGRWPDFWGDPGLARRLALAAAVNAALAALGYLGRGVNRSGMIAGFLVGTAIWLFLGWRGYLLLLAFFVVGTACTKLGYARKAALAMAQEEGGRRGARHALAKTSVPAACALFAALTGRPELYALAFAAAFATATADTASSELGKLWGRRTFLITTLRPVPRGTEGAVSLEGTLAGIVAAAAIAALGVAVGLVATPAGAAVVVAAAFVANTLESVVGATLERRGLLDNEAVNFLNTLTGAVLAGLAARLLPGVAPAAVLAAL
jgi:uncharacterized protein (TIGR00297 family)